MKKRFSEEQIVKMIQKHKEGKDYVERTISNFLEFIEQDKAQE